MISASVQDVRKFIMFAAKELQLTSMPVIKLTGSQENKFSAFGHSKGNVIVVRITDRHPIDICRTLAHEMLHYKETVMGVKSSDNQKEDTANVVAGRIVRKFDIAHPEVFKDKAIRANMMQEMTLQGVGGNMSGPPAIQGYDPVMDFHKGRKGGEYGLKNLFKRKEKPGKSLSNVLKREKDLDKN